MPARNAVLSLICLALTACIPENPVRESGTPDEYEYNVWLLDRLYLHSSELPEAEARADGNVTILYDTLSDPYTRYVPPAQAEESETEISSSLIPGDIGVELMVVSGNTHPLYLYRIYPQGPAGQAGIPRYSNLLSINGVPLQGDSALTTYQTTLEQNRNITLCVAYQGDTLTYTLVKETIYAPTVFTDTLNGLIFITIREFIPNTADRAEGTLGELKAALETTQNSGIRVIDIRNNPGGYVSQCVNAADLFVSEGLLSTRITHTFEGDGSPTIKEVHYRAQSGDIGESGKFILLVGPGTASCGEIFAAAVQENTTTPLVGETTYGKGVGQETWSTLAGGLAIITNTEFRTPSGMNYQGTGLAPDILCEDNYISCASEAVDTLQKQDPSLAKTGENVPAHEADSIYTPRKVTKGALLP